MRGVGTECNNQNYFFECSINLREETVEVTLPTHLQKFIQNTLY